MADAPTRKDGRKGTPACAAAREALLRGDYRQARALATAVLADAAAPEDAKAEAAGILEATRVDRTPIIAGFVMVAVLALLFWYALSQHH
jgi:hypothetical protein